MKYILIFVFFLAKGEKYDSESEVNQKNAIGKAIGLLLIDLKLRSPFPHIVFFHFKVNKVDKWQKPDTITRRYNP